MTASASPVRVLALVALGLLLALPAQAGRFVYEPASDLDDGQLVDGVHWDPLLAEETIDDLLIRVGQEGASTYDASVAFHAPDLGEGLTVHDVRLRVSSQGAVITNGLVLRITAALDPDPRAADGADRFALPRTSASVTWNVTAPWDSSGQRIAKYEESPNLAAIVNEVIAQPGWDGGSRDLVLFLELDVSIGDNVVRFDDRHGRFTLGGNAGIPPAQLRVAETFRDAFWGREMLCRPKPTAMGVNIVPHVATQAYVEWGTDGVTFPWSTATASIAARTAHVFTMTGLDPDTGYHYRLQARPAAGGAFEAGPVRRFLTLPGSGQEVRICATADIHVTNQLALGLDSSMELLETSLDYMPGHLGDDPFHFWLDLGDLVVIRALRIPFDAEEVEQRYRTAREYVDRIAHSLPLVFVRGNHEEVNGWDYDGTPDNTAVWSGRMLLKYLAPPLPDAFYSGNTVAYPDLGLPGNYYAFDAGNLRIRALDPYLFSNTRPHNGHGEVNGSLDAWDWTIGTAQYQWLKDDLATRDAPFELLAIHHLTSSYSGPGLCYGRGGIEVGDHAVDGRPSFEWGGEDDTGDPVLATRRPDFDAGAPHDLLVAHGNQVLMKGHEHFHARQALDGMIYLTMAKPDDTGEHTGDLWGWRYSSFYPDAVTLFESNSGFYTIVAGGGSATWSYVQTYPTEGLGTVRDSFTVLPAAPTGVEGVAGVELRRSWIRAAAPNPARGEPVRISWENGRAGPARLAIHDVSGRVVRELDTGGPEAGLRESVWDGRDSAGRRVASGVYFAKLIAGGQVDAVKMILLR